MGFHAHADFELVGAVDAQKGKPSSGDGTLECNLTYERNIGLKPLEEDLAVVDPKLLASRIIGGSHSVDVLIACAPCTGFSRTNPQNHLDDDPRNALVPRTALFVEAFRPRVLVMENARELIRGNYAHHFLNLKDRLSKLGYIVRGDIRFLNQFGLPQKRERALVVAVKGPLLPLTLDDLWRNYGVSKEAVTVRAAIGRLPQIEAGKRCETDPMHESPSLGDVALRRMALTPADGGSWTDMARMPGGMDLLIPSLRRKWLDGDLGSHPDVYGRMYWERPAPTIKRECAHIGNGRYAHPEQDRLCTVREMASLQGFPRHFEFVARSLANKYRHIGDAVPPMISFQIAHLCSWILTGRQPALVDVVMPECHLLPSHIIARGDQGDLWMDGSIGRIA